MKGKVAYWWLKMFAICLFLVMFSSCASIIKGGTQVMNVKTDPPQANCVISNMRNGSEVAHITSPSATVLQRGTGYFEKGQYKVSCLKDGYEKKEVALEGSAGGWYIAGNLLFGGLIGWFIVDPITGAMWNLEPETVDLTLSKKGEAPQTVGAVIENMNVPQMPLQPIKASEAPATPTSAPEPRAIFIK